MTTADIYLGFDPGNGETKVLSGTGRYSAPSVVTEAGMSANTITLTSQERTETFCYGYVSRESSVQTVASRRGKAEQIQKLYAIGLSLLPEITAGEYVVHLVCSSPYHGSADRELFTRELSKELGMQRADSRVFRFVADGSVVVIFLGVRRRVPPLLLRDGVGQQHQSVLGLIAHVIVLKSKEVAQSLGARENGRRKPLERVREPLWVEQVVGVGSLGRERRVLRRTRRQYRVRRRRRRLE